MTTGDIGRFFPAEMDALNEIARMKLYYTEKVEIRAEILNRLAEGLRQIYPGLSMVKIRNKIKRTYWEITSPNTNGDPNDNEDFKWYVHGDGTVHRVLTEHEQNEKVRRERPKKFPERSEEEDIFLMNYYYQILRRVAWFDQSFDEIELRERRSGSVTCRNAILDQELERRNLVCGSKPGGMTNKEWQTASARGFDRDAKTQADIDWKFRQNNPTNVLYHRVKKIYYMCECTRESLRNGKICNICKLSKMVNVYVLNLFKNAAEGCNSIL